MAQNPARKNERKRDVLEQLAEDDALTSRQIAEQSGITPSGIRSVLARLKRRGHVEVEGGEFAPGRGSQAAKYSITDRGEEKLRWLRRSDHGRA